MNHLAVGLVLVGCVFAALYNIASKRMQIGHWKERSSALVALHQGGASLLFLGIAFATGGPQIHPGFWFAAIATGILNIGIMYGKMRGRALEDVSLVAPIDSTTPAIVIVTSFLLLGEMPGRLGWAGIWLLALGMYDLNLEDFRTKLEARLGEQEPSASWGRRAWRWFLLWTSPFRALATSKGVRWAFFASMLATVSLNYDGVSARQANVAFASCIVFGIAALGNLVVALTRKEFSGLAPGDTLRHVAPAAILFTLSNYVTNFAYRETIVPYVGTMKRVQIPLTIILAYILLGEKKSFRSRLFGGTLMAIGAVCITLD
jgi:drug/metabolite transporter (DMT)-like permease